MLNVCHSRVAWQSAMQLFKSIESLMFDVLFTRRVRSTTKCYYEGNEIVNIAISLFGANI